MSYTHSTSIPGLMPRLKAAKNASRGEAVMLCAEAYYEILRLKNENNALKSALCACISPVRRAPAGGGEGRSFAS